MLVFKFLNLDHAFVFEFCEFSLPVSVELLQLFISDLDVFSQLFLLNVNSELVLELVDICLEKTHLPHEIFVQLVFLHVAELLRKDTHFLLDQGKDNNLLIFVQLAIASLVEYFEELHGARQP